MFFAGPAKGPAVHPNNLGKFGIFKIGGNTREQKDGEVEAGVKMTQQK